MKKINISNNAQIAILWTICGIAAFMFVLITKSFIENIF